MTEPISQTTIAESSIAAARAVQAVTGAASLPSPAWPSSDELIFDDGIPMDTPRHRQQMELLIETLNLHWADRQDFYVGGNMFVYFSPNQVKNEDFRGPDFYVVLGTDRRRERKGWVVWEEGGKTPDVIVELLSESTADFDKLEKKEIYRTRLGAPEYYWFDPFDAADFAGFVARRQRYSALQPDKRGRLISPAMGLALARWEGAYQEVDATWLRWETLDGKLLPTNAERAREANLRADLLLQRAEQEQLRAEQERQYAEQERQYAKQERQRAEQAEARVIQEQERARLLAAKLRELGIDPESLK